MKMKYKVPAYVLWLTLFISAVLLLLGFTGYLFKSGFMWFGFGISALSYFWVCLKLALEIGTKKGLFMFFYLSMVILLPYLSMIFYLIRYESVWELKSFKYNKLA